MGLFNKDGTRKPFAQYMTESRVKARNRQPIDTSGPLQAFQTRIPVDVLRAFNDEIKYSRDKIQTVIMNFMIEYIKRGGGDDGKNPRT